MSACYCFGLGVLKGAFRLEGICLNSQYLDLTWNSYAEISDEISQF